MNKKTIIEKLPLMGKSLKYRTYKDTNFYFVSKKRKEARDRAKQKNQLSRN